MTNTRAVVKKTSGSRECQADVWQRHISNSRLHDTRRNAAGSTQRWRRDTSFRWWREHAKATGISTFTPSALRAWTLLPAAAPSPALQHTRPRKRPIDLLSKLPSKKWHQGVSSSPRSSVRSVNLTNSHCLSRCWHLHSSISVSPPLPLLPPPNSSGRTFQRCTRSGSLVYGIRGMPVLAHCEVSKQTQWVHCKLMVQGCQLDRSDVTLITTRDRMILTVANERVQYHVLPLTETTIRAGVTRASSSLS